MLVLVTFEVCRRQEDASAIRGRGARMHSVRLQMNVRGIRSTAFGMRTAEMTTQLVQRRKTELALGSRACVGTEFNKQRLMLNKLDESH
jgi:hypothetical protein